jgi:hypothetical protein
VIVQQFLDGITAQNKVTLDAYQSNLKDFTAANDAAWETAKEQVGGEEVWDSIEVWAQGSLQDADFDAFNKVMSSGDAYAQRLAIADMKQRMESNEGDASADLITGDDGGKAVSGTLNQADYLALFSSGEYYKDPAKYDAQRRKGMAKGQ